MLNLKPKYCIGLVLLLYACILSTYLVSFIYSMSAYIQRQLWEIYIYICTILKPYLPKPVISWPHGLNQAGLENTSWLCYFNLYYSAHLSCKITQVVRIMFHSYALYGFLYRYCCKTICLSYRSSVWNKVHPLYCGRFFGKWHFPKDFAAPEVCGKLFIPLVGCECTQQKEISFVDILVVFAHCVLA